jgi:hypothetical protein
MFRLATKFRPDSAAFATATAAGFRNAEFWLDAEVLADWRNVVSVAREHPFHYALHFPNAAMLPRDAVEQAVRLYGELECEALAIHQAPFLLYGDALRSLEPSLNMGVENHRLSQQEFDRWARQSPGLTLDVEHFWKYTLENAPLDELEEKLEKFLQRFGDKLHHVHLPGYTIGGKEHSPMYCGAPMVKRVFGVLADCGFCKFVVSEADEEHQNEVDMRRDVELYRAWRNEYYGAKAGVGTLDRRRAQGE